MSFKMLLPWKYLAQVDEFCKSAEKYGYANKR